MTTKWMGSTPKCDFCEKTGNTLQQFVDGRTVFGPWAIMCPDCFKKNGVGVGLGSGQEYHRQEDGTYLKVK